jgi:hypothetical protein
MMLGGFVAAADRRFRVLPQRADGRAPLPPSAAAAVADVRA